MNYVMKHIIYIFVIGLMWTNYPQTAYCSGVALSLNSEHNLILNKMKNQEEIWKAVEGYELQYQISNLGRIKSLTRIVNCGFGKRIIKEKILKPNITKKGYYIKHLINKTYLYHRLVAIAFIPNPENKPCVNHIDGNKINNNMNNLEWCTYSENNQHSYDIGLSKGYYKGKKGIDHCRSKPIIQYSIDGVYLNRYESIIEVEIKLGVNHTAICNCLKGYCKTSGGYKWEYV